jgi:hypothetical protein
MSEPVVVVYVDAGELAAAFYPADEPGVYPPIEAEEIARRLNVAEAKIAAGNRLRAAVAALMATKRAWWYDSEYSQCMYCDSSTYHTSETVTHAPDCPAMAVEAAMKEGDDA